MLKGIITLSLFCLAQQFFAQGFVIDKVIGVVGKYPILLSDLQTAMLGQEKQEQTIDKCKSYEMLVFQKLLLAQADRDSVTVSDAEVDHELDRRMAHFVRQFGSEQKLEEYYGKRTNVIKDDFRPEVQQQLLAQKMEGKIAGDIKPTPADIRIFFKSIPEDSLPLINSEVELEQIVKKPTHSAEAKAEAKAQLEVYRQRILKGEAGFATLARLYSEDPGSAQKGGEYKSVARGIMDPSFEGVAFRLKNGEISNVFETSYGYHIIELIQRKGELLDLRHILVIPKMDNNDFYKCKTALDTIYSQIKQGKFTFEEAAQKFSDDKDTKQNGGLMMNAQTASTKFDNEDLSQLDEKLIVTLNPMQVGEVSKPMQFTSTTDGKPGYRLLKLKNRIDPHKTNVKDDYQKLALMAAAFRKKEMVKEWIKKRSKITYIKLDSEFICKFQNEWTINSN